MNFRRLDRIKRRSSRAALDNLKNKKDLVGAEVGVDHGINAKWMLEQFDIKTLYLIDPYATYLTVSGKIKTQRRAEKIARAYLKEFRDKIIWLKEPSWNAVFKLPELDFVYIDGNHEYPYVKVDTELYYPKVKSGGLFSGQDYSRHRRHGGVVRAVNEFFEGIDEELQTGKRADWWCIKR